MVDILTMLLVDISRRFQTIGSLLHTKRQEQEKRRERLGAFRPTIEFHEVPVIDDGDGHGQDETLLMITMPTLRTSHQLMSPSPQIGLLMERASQIRDLEANVIEMGDMFRKLAEHVAIQNEQILRIDDNLMMADIHADEAHRQLTHYLTSVSTNRWLAVKIFGVLLVFIVLFIVFFI